MGSWHETCALSSLPILPGDEVVWLLLTKNPYDECRGVYFNDHYYARSVPIYGTYADYGEVEPAPDEEFFLELVKRQFAQDLMPQEQTDRDKACGIPAVNKGGYSFDLLQDWLHEGHVKIDSEHLYAISNLQHNERTRKRMEEMRAYCAHDTCPIERTASMRPSSHIR